jgi:hypothetical protein
MNLPSIWSALEESSEILGDYAYPAIDKAAERLSLPPDYFTWTAAMWLFDSQPFDMAQYMRVFPYGLSQVNEKLFASAIQQGYLTSDGRESYRATELGMTVATRLFHSANEAIAPLHPMPEESLQRLVNLLARMSDAAFGLPEPPPHFILTRKRELYRRMEMVASLEGFVAHNLELEGHRDDCYLTAWGEYHVEGHAWDMLDFLSRSDTVTFADMHGKLSRRGVTEEVHVGDVKELVRRGWMEESSDVIRITSAGKQVRAEVEAETERPFFAPWSCLNESELEELYGLAVQLRNGLKDK